MVANRGRCEASDQSFDSIDHVGMLMVAIDWRTERGARKPNVIRASQSWAARGPPQINCLHRLDLRTSHRDGAWICAALQTQ